MREDLYYRLSVINIRVPSLGERRGDIPLLIDSFLRRRSGGARRAISEAALLKLSEIDWPGNVRQLLHVVENACVMSAAEVLDVGDFAIEDEAGGETEGIADSGSSEELDLRTNLERLERMLIKRAMIKTGGNRARAARILGIRRQHLYSRIEALKIEDDS